MLNHYIKLLKHNFYNDYENAILFESEAERDAYFNVSSLFSNLTNADQVNFDYGNYLNTKATVRTDAKAVASADYNYAIVKDKKNSKYYFYFITNMRYDSAGIDANTTNVVLDLELDVMTTYYPSLVSGNKIGKCNISRAHGERFTIDNNNELHFICNKKSIFSQVDTFDKPKFLKSRASLTPLIQTNATGINNFNTWVENNVLCWLYIYTREAEYTFHKMSSNANDTEWLNFISYGKDDFANQQILTAGYGVSCVPVYKRGCTARMKFVDNLTLPTKEIYIDIPGFLRFINNGNNSEGVYNAKLSYIPPFTSKKYVYDTDFTIDSNTGDLLIKSSTFGSKDIGLYFDAGGGVTLDNLTAYNSFEGGDSNNHGIINVPRQITINYPFTTGNRDLRLIFNPVLTKSDFLGNRNTKFNPALKNEHFTNLKFTDTAGNEYTTPVYSVLQNDLGYNFILTEILTPDVTKVFLRFLDMNDFHNNPNNLDGLILSNDLSIPFSESDLATFLANNKNFFMQSMFGAGMQVINKNPAGAVTGLVNDYFKLNNLQESGGRIQNANGNGLFNFLINGDEIWNAIESNGLIIEYNQALDIELQKQDDYNALCGYPVNLIDSINNVQHLRLYYDFVQADIKYINTSLQLNIINKIKEIFSKGVRLWHLDSDYALPDYNTAINSNNPELSIVEA